MSVGKWADDRARALVAHPFFGQDVWRFLEQRVAASGDRPFLVWDPYDTTTRTWTYADFVRDAASVAAGMQHRGIRPGDRVLIHLENCPEFLISWFACAAVGAVAVTTNTRSVRDELAYYIDDSGAVAAITQPSLAETVSSSGADLSWIAVIDHDAGSASSSFQGDSFASLRRDPTELAVTAIDPLAPMSVQYTSGTTSRPKGVLWTHANALWAARVNATHENLQPYDCQIVYMPLFHTNALSYSMLATLWAGSRAVLVPKWSSSRFWDVSLRHGCTWLSVMGLAYRALMAADVPDGHQYRHAGFGICNTPLDRRLGVKTIGWFGMTETVSHPIIGSAFVPDRPMAMGRAAAEYQLAVVREDGVTPTEPDEVGQLLVKGVPGLSLFAEYLNLPEVTAASFDQFGRFATGDLVTLHADGYLSYAERSKDVLRVGAENVSASEVERVILGTGLAREVAVVGRHDRKLDEVPVAFVVASETGSKAAARILAACVEKLADFKVPRDVYFVSEMPRSTLNKINKVELRAVAAPDAEAERREAESRWQVEATRDPSGDLGGFTAVDRGPHWMIANASDATADQR